MKIRIFLIFTILNLIFLGKNSFAQSAKVDSLMQRLDVLGQDTGRVNTLNRLADEIWRYDPFAAQNYARQAAELALKLDYKAGRAKSYNRIARTYALQTNNEEALNLYFKSLEISQEIGDYACSSQNYNGIGHVYSHEGEYDKALEYYNKTLKIYEQQNYWQGILEMQINIGKLNEALNRNDKALTCFEQALSISRKMKNQTKTADALCNIGYIHFKNEKYSIAIENIRQSLEIREIEGDYYGLAISHLRLGKIYTQTHSFDKARQHLQSSQRLARKTASYKTLLHTFQVLTALDSAQGNWQQALGYAQKYIRLKDSIFSSERSKQIAKMQAFYEMRKKEEEIAWQKQEIIEKQKQLNKKQRQRDLLIFGLLLLAITAAGALYSNHQRRSANKKLIAQNIAMSQQKDELEKKAFLLRRANETIGQNSQLISQKNRDITQSITYASMIQMAVFPAKNELLRLFPLHFTLFKPKAIVSGDFYWVKQIGKKTVLAVADCTGHGVPGAFMSMMGIALLNEIVVDRKILAADQILSELRQDLSQVLGRAQTDQEPQDGMDIAIAIVDTQKNTLEFAGANNPLYLFRNHQKTDETALTELFPDRHPLGIHLLRNDFSAQNITIKEGDMIYLFSDGYTSQLGGRKTPRKFTSRRFKKLLAEIAHKNMLDQRQILENRLNEWRGNTFEQLDDVLVFGFRYKPEK